MAESRVGGFVDVATASAVAPASVRRTLRLRKSQWSDISGEWSGHDGVNDSLAIRRVPLAFCACNSPNPGCRNPGSAANSD
jgi:hypothetical protein